MARPLHPLPAITAERGSLERTTVTGRGDHRGIGWPGIGRALARLYGARGASVGLIARGVAGLEGAAREVEAAGGKALILPLDVADAKAIEAATERSEQELGPIEVWINNAMTSVFSPVHQMTPEEYERVTQVTYLGYVYGTLAVLRRMRARDRGTIRRDEPHGRARPCWPG